MDGNLYERVYRLVQSLDHPDPPGVTHSDRTVVPHLDRAAADGLSLLQVARRGHRVGLTPPATWPSQPTLSRRARSPSVQAPLARVEDRPRSLDPPPAAAPAVAAVDGRALDVGEHTGDPDARTGRGTGRFEKGYEAHVLWGAGCRVAVALLAALPPAAGPAFVLGDAAYDVNYLYAAARERGWQLLAPPKNPGRRLGHRRHDPGWRAGPALPATPAGQALHAGRTAVERQFAARGTRPEGLNELPKHVRRLPRVRLHVTLSLHLNAVRILMNRNALPDPRRE